MVPLNGEMHFYFFNQNSEFCIFMFLQIASMFSIIWGLSLVVFLFGRVNLLSFYPALISPGIVAIIYLVFLINPFPFLFYKARKWLLKRLVRIC